MRKKREIEEIPEYPINTIVNDVRIAQFMEFTQKSYTPTSEKIWCDHRHGLPVGELKFSTHLDWLMGVIDKIENNSSGLLITQLQFYPDKVFGNKYSFMISMKREMGMLMLVHVHSKTRIGALYNGVVAFIDWKDEEEKFMNKTISDI